MDGGKEWVHFSRIGPSVASSNGLVTSGHIGMVVHRWETNPRESVRYEMTNCAPNFKTRQAVRRSLSHLSLANNALRHRLFFSQVNLAHQSFFYRVNAKNLGRREVLPRFFGA